MRRLMIPFAVLALLLFGAGLHYALPQVDVVRIVGTDVKRVDAPAEGGAAESDAGLRTSDVYFILTETQDGDVRNYRNEDALIYGKFDSSDLHTRARSISQNEDNLVAIRHYGWRIPIFSMFPNAVSLWEVEPGYRHLPIFNIAILALLAGGVGYAALRLRRMRRRRAERRAEREAERAAEEARRAKEQAAAAERAPERNADREKALEAFLSDGGSRGSGGSDGGGS